MEPVDWGAVAAAVVSLWFFSSGAYAALVAGRAIRGGAFAPGLGIDVHGPVATALGWATLAIAAAFLAAGALVAYAGAGGGAPQPPPTQ